MRPFLRNIFKHLAYAIAVAGLIGAGAMKAHGQEADGGVPGDWLSRYAGARTLGIGGAFVAAGDDALAVAWNPAGLSVLSQNEVYFETARLFESTSLHGFGVAMPARSIPSFSLTVLSLRSGDFERTNDLNQPLGTFGETDLAFLLTASKNLTRRLAVGANFKVVRQSIDEFDAAGIGADLGVLFDVTPSLRVGASFLNVGGPALTLRDFEETFPTEIRAGVAIRFLSGRGMIAADVNHREGPGVSFHGGSEFWVHERMALRAGYSDESPTGGLSYRIAPGMRFDYGASYDELGVTHRVGLQYRFGGFFASSQAIPSVFSPIGEHSVTKINLRAKTKAEPLGWTLDIVDKSGQVVRRFGGKGNPPAHVMWDGKEETGLPLPDGAYSYRLIVEDSEGREIIGPERKVEISTSGPRGSVPVIIE